MIEKTEGSPEGVVELRASGTVTGDDYEKVVVPAIEDALLENEKVRLLYHLGADFESFSAGAAWDDTKLGLEHWTAFERMAVVTDVGWVKNSFGMLGFALPCPVQVFSNSQLEEARRWLQESLGSIHFEGEDTQRLARVRLLGQIEPSAYRAATPNLDAFMAKHQRVRLLLDLTDFQGWEGVGALREHFALVRDHHRSVERVAVVGNREWERQLAKLMSRFIDAEARYFDANEMASAEKWVTEGA